MAELCLHPGCTEMAFFPAERTGDNGETITGMACFAHSDDGPVVAIEPEQAGGFHIDVVNGLAAMLLEHTAMTMVGTEDATGDAMRSLAANTDWTEDVAAGVLLALSYIAAAGQVGDEELLHGAEVYEQQAAEADTEEAPTEPFPHPEEAEAEVVEEAGEAPAADLREMRCRKCSVLLLGPTERDTGLCGECFWNDDGAPNDDDPPQDPGRPAEEPTEETGNEHDQQQQHEAASGG